MGKAISDAINRWIKAAPPPPIYVPPAQPLPGPFAPPVSGAPPTSATPLPAEVPEELTREQQIAKEAVQTRSEREKGDCCNSFQFQYVWPKAVKNANLPGNGNTRKDNERRFQIITCGMLEYHCFGTGNAKAWADGLNSGICYMKDAKWSQSRNSPYRLENSIPEAVRIKINQDIESLFLRYGKIIKAPLLPVTPCWKIGLHVIINTVETYGYFAQLCTKAKIPKGRWFIEIRHMNTEGISGLYNNVNRKADVIANQKKNIYDNVLQKLDRKIMDKLNESLHYLPDGRPIYLFPKL
ncbi:hypothetical protein [Pseudovibrio denitrificans]|uniref:hypothetical protein n=1 Tax=Pseudovibrio denitrificans TaxID=258256 RepID=UPI0013E3C177|nr:hypothetical protein [Pseudovibrio denitrificans]